MNEPSNAQHNKTPIKLNPAANSPSSEEIAPLSSTAEEASEEANSDSETKRSSSYDVLGSFHIELSEVLLHPGENKTAGQEEHLGKIDESAVSGLNKNVESSNLIKDNNIASETEKNKTDASKITPQSSAPSNAASETVKNKTNDSKSTTPSLAPSKAVVAEATDSGTENPPSANSAPPKEPDVAKTLLDTVREREERLKNSKKVTTSRTKSEGLLLKRHKKNQDEDDDEAEVLILEALRKNDTPDLKGIAIPEKKTGYLYKMRADRTKRFHRRYYCLDRGILTYAEGKREFEKAKYHGVLDLGLSVVTINLQSKRFSIDDGDEVYTFKADDAKDLEEWRHILHVHRIYRQSWLQANTEISLGQVETAVGIEKGELNHTNSKPEVGHNKNDNLTEDVRNQVNTMYRNSLRGLTKLDQATMMNLTLQATGIMDDMTLSKHRPSAFNVAGNVQNLDSAQRSLKLSQDYMSRLKALIEQKEMDDSSPFDNETRKKDEKKTPSKLSLFRRKKKFKSVSADNQTFEEPPSISITKSQPGSKNNSKVNIIEPERKPNSDLISASPVSDVSVSGNINFNDAESVNSLSHASSGNEAADNATRNLDQDILLHCRDLLTHLHETYATLQGVYDKLAVNELNAEEGTRASLRQQSATEKLKFFPPVSKAGSLRHNTAGSNVELFYDAVEAFTEEIVNESSSSDSESDELEPQKSEHAIGYESDTKDSDTAEPRFVAPQRVSNLMRRTVLPSPRIDTGLSLFSVLKSAIGRDLARISLPIGFNEPLGLLQRMCEELEYCDLLNRAAEASDPSDRCLYIAAFLISGTASSIYRSATKPFNPILGETYETIREDKGFRYIAEQVSHHPTISASFAESEKWNISQDMRLRTKFWGRSMEVTSDGICRLQFPNLEEVYSWGKPNSHVHNIFSSQRWIELVGDVKVVCGNGYTCEIQFQKSTFMSPAKHVFRGQVKNQAGQVTRYFGGKWCEAFFACDCPIDGKPVDPIVSGREMWRPSVMPTGYEDYYGFTFFAMQLNEFDGIVYPPTDTRFRPDQRLLEEGRHELADVEKKRIETLQRNRRSDSEAEGTPHVPLWFVRLKENETQDEWVYNRKYWAYKENPGFDKMSFPTIW